MPAQQSNLLVASASYGGGSFAARKEGELARQVGCPGTNQEVIPVGLLDRWLSVS
jgi:hypothetical protein